MTESLSNKYSGMVTGLMVLLLILIICNCACGQIMQKQFVIITFEDQYKISQHSKKSYYWIVPVDSVKADDFKLSRLVLNGYSKQVLESSRLGQKVYPYEVTTASSYDFSKAYFEQLSLLESIVYQNRRKVQQVNKVWISGQKETIRIYATPVMGSFCFTKLDNYGVLISAYTGNIYFPYSGFSCNQAFWKSQFAKNIINQDYSTVKFDVLPY